MRDHTEQLPDVLASSFGRRMVVDVMHGSDRVLQDLPLLDWGLTSDMSGEIKSSGDATIIYSSVDGETLVPEGTTGVLSPFRATITMAMQVSAGAFTENVTLGLFQVTAVPEAQNYWVTVDGRDVIVACTVKIEFSSLDEGIQRRGFHYPEQPSSTDSIYDEIRRITGLPAEETVPDKNVPSITYEAEQGGRLKGLQALASSLGGTAAINSVGAVSVIPDLIGEPVYTLALGENGTVLDLSYQVDTANVYNVVVGVFERDDRAPLYAVATATGDLDPGGNYGEYTRYASAPGVSTQAQAQSTVDGVLAESIGSQMYDIPITCHVDPLPEIGDVVQLEGWERPIVGQLRSVEMSDEATMKVVLRVARRLQ